MTRCGARIRGASPLALPAIVARSNPRFCRTRLWRSATLPLLVALLAGGCNQHNEAPALSTVARLTDALVRPLGVPASCQIDDEIRPSFGCLPSFPLLDKEVPWPESRRIRVDLQLPEYLLGRAVALTPTVATLDEVGFVALPAILTRGTSTEVALDLEIPAIKHKNTLRVLVRAVALPQRSRSWTTRPIPIPPDAILSVALGILPAALEIGAPPVQFTIRAVEVGASRQVLDETLSAKDRRRGWVQRRIDLSKFAGSEVSFTFRARWQDKAADGGAGFGAPLFSAPVLLAPRPTRRQANIVLISLDTLRSDFTGKMLDGKALTPRLDALAADGVRFEQAISAYPSTTASHMSLLTGLYPATHRTVFAGTKAPEDLPTLAGTLAGEGYTTAAVTENGMITAASGFARGFDSYRENKSVSIWDAMGDIETTFAEAGRWLRSHRQERFFLFVHSYEVHDPYTPPSRHDRFVPPPPSGDRKKDNAERLRRKYAGEVGYTDQMVGHLLGELERLGLDDTTIVVVTSDHGEEFAEHGNFFHSHTVYDEVIRVPIILRAPGLVRPGQRIEDQLSLIDLAPTLLDLVGIDTPKAMQGQSVSALLSGAHNLLGMRVRYMEGPMVSKFRGNEGRLIGARDGFYKYIGYENGSAPTEIYDLKKDPGETRNLAANLWLQKQGQQLLDRYRDLLRAGQAAAAAEEAAAAEIEEPDPAVQRKLQALGYVD